MTDSVLEKIKANLRDVRERIVAACARSDRNPEDVTLVSVTKYAEPEWVDELLALGEHHLGESRPQQMIERAKQLPEDIQWHLIGHLQRNKARAILPVTSLIHSVDSLRLLNTLNRLADELKIRPRVLIEVNVTGEETKDGFPVEELTNNWGEFLTCDAVQIEGLMTMAPRIANPEDARPVFRQLRELRDQLIERSTRLGNPLELTQLSMGMSGDYEVAIEEGATLVRIGSKLFEGCHA
ncbi:MAG: YggS family pyridoxal phosphate-dependent enzyme [Planctomycetaceae bacterium]